VALKFDSNINLASIAVSLGTNTNDYTPTGLSGVSLIWITPTASFSLTGLTGGEEGRLMFIGIRNPGSFVITIPAESASSSAANRFAHAINLDVSAGGSNKAIVTAWIYLGSRWRKWKF
jgi:hypothetical protein